MTWILMEKQSNRSSFDTCPSNGSYELQHPPVFRPSILNVCPKPPLSDSGQSGEKSTGTVNSTSSKLIQTTSSVSVPKINPLNEELAPKDYVFGSNISSRVVNADVTQGASSNLWDVAKTEVSSSCSVFTALAKAVASKKVNKDSCSEQTLEDSANKVTEDQKNATVTLAQVEAFTGEEGEIQIFRMHCRAYVFDTDKQCWNALGASHFHLNDIPKNEDGNSGDCSSGYRSRVVVRLMSTRRVIINTPVWDKMPVAVVDSRSLRIGAINEDGDQLRSYLFKFPPDESASKICTALNTRKTRAAEANSIKTEELTTTRIAGQKRTSEASANHPAISSSFPTQSDRSSSETGQPTITVNPSSIFRPSVFCASEGSSVLHSQSTALTKNPEVAGGILFRQSALDPVVKRLRSDQHDTEISQSSPQEKVNLSQPLNVPPAPKTAVVNLPTTGGVSGNFVFGQNISERVKNTNNSSSFQEPSTSDSREEDSTEEYETAEITPCPNTLTDSANAVAAELRDRSTILSDEIPKELLLTGEEGECTVLKTYCRFYDFDRDKQLWIERGNAYVHLNDIPLPIAGADTPNVGAIRPPSGPPMRSRMVVRVCKTLKLLANISLWSELNVTMADERSIRLMTICFTTVDAYSVQEQQPTEVPAKPEFRAYLLVMRSPNDATRLYQALIARKNVTTRNHLHDEDPIETEASPPEHNAAHDVSDAGLCLSTDTVEAAADQNSI